MKGHKKKLGILLLALVLALGGLGIGYTHWTDSLYIAGTAHIAENDPGFVPGSCEFSQHPDDPDEDDDCDCDCIFTDSDGDGDYDTMEATIINVDTFCVYRLYSTIRNDGTLPMRIKNIQVTYDSPVMIAEEESLVNTVLDPGDEATLKLSIAIGAAMADTYTFSVKITSCPWNQ
jgi:hypothetical protein